MKLEKSLAGKVLIILYYTFALAVDIILMLFIWLITDSFWVGLGVSFVVGIGIGVLGGELEYREHRKVKYGNCFRKRRAEEPNNVINFPV